MLNTARSALLLILPIDITNNPDIKRLFKAFSKQKPPKPKYNFIWDPFIVLKFLSTWYPNFSLTLEKLTRKLVTLLALTSAQRVQTLSLIKIDNIELCNTTIFVKVPDKIKTSGINRFQPLIELTTLDGHPEICVVELLKYYIEKTSNLRNEQCKNLFITVKKPFHSASSQTISKWIKNTLQEAGIDISIFTAHSTRHAATSAAFKNGVAIDVIKKAACWTNNSAVFAKHYNLPLSSNTNVLSSLLKLSNNNK